MWKLIAACLALGGASLALPSEPSYDPLAWLIWGRELIHLQLDTTGGPSWKPLPVAVTTLLAPLGELDRGLPPAIWIALARAGSLLALALAFRLVRRLAGGGLAGALGGAVAALALALTPDWFQFAAQGSEAPVAVALMLWAIERHLDGRPDHVLAVGTLACLLRPELVPFLVLYCAWAWRAVPRLRPYTVGAGALLALLWVVPDWLGSGVLLDGGAQARSEPAWSLSLAERPWLRALERVHNHVGLPLELLGLAALAAAVARRRRVELALGAAALAGAALFVAMTEAGFSGNPRYVLPALAIWCVLAGLGAAHMARGGPARTVAAACLLALALHGFAGSRVERLRAEAREVGVRMEVHRDLARAVRLAGGAVVVRSAGPVAVNRALQTRLAWELRVPIDAVERLGEARLVFRSRLEGLVGRVYFLGRARTRRTVARAGTVRVYRRDDLSYPILRRAWLAGDGPFTSPLQGVHTPVLRGRKTGTGVVTR